MNIISKTANGFQVEVSIGADVLEVIQASTHDEAKIIASESERFLMLIGYDASKYVSRGDCNLSDDELLAELTA